MENCSHSHQSVFALKAARALLNYLNVPADDQLVVKLDDFARLVCLFRKDVSRLTPELIHKLTARFALQICRFDLLARFLHARNMMSAFPDVVAAFSRFYREKHGILFCTLTSSHLLEEAEKEAAIQFVEQKTGKRFFYTSIVNERLIAGIRIEGETLLWEHSIAQHLRILQRFS